MRSYVAPLVSRLLPALGIAALLASPALTHAHSNLISPPPRDGSSGYKDPQGPCGPPPHTSPTLYQSGQNVTVTWVESVYHPGCFVIDLALANDANWQPLKTIDHAASTTSPINYSAQLTLPQGVTCTACTLRVRQLMLGAQGTCPPADIQAGQTYYSCADVTISGPAVDLGQPTAPDLGAIDAGGATPMVSGCQAAPAGVVTGSLSGLALLGLAALTLGRRRVARSA